MLRVQMIRFGPLTCIVRYDGQQYTVWTIDLELKNGAYYICENCLD